MRENETKSVKSTKDAGRKASDRVKKRNQNINQVTGTVIRSALKVIIYVVIIMAILTMTRVGYNFGYSIFNGQPIDSSGGKTVTVTVEEGDSIQAVAAKMQEKGLVENSLVVVIQKTIFGFTIYPGTYSLETTMTSLEMLKVLSVDTGIEETSETTAAPIEETDPTEEPETALED